MLGKNGVFYGFTFFLFIFFLSLVVVKLSDWFLIAIFKWVFVCIGRLMVVFDINIFGRTFRSIESKRKNLSNSRLLMGIYIRPKKQSFNRKMHTRFGIGQTISAGYLGSGIILFIFFVFRH